jgi:hypothetical protein
MWDSQCLTTLWASMACYRDSFTFTFTAVRVFETFSNDALEAGPFCFAHDPCQNQVQIYKYKSFYIILTSYGHRSEWSATGESMHLKLFYEMSNTQFLTRRNKRETKGRNDLKMIHRTWKLWEQPSNDAGELVWAVGVGEYINYIN